MRSITTRIFILFSAILIAVIIGMQVHWLNKTYAFEKNEFNTSVLKSIRGVYEDMPLLFNTAIPLDSLVEKYQYNGFLFQVHTVPDKDSLMTFLAAELEDFSVFTDCKVAVYDKGRGQYSWETYLSADANRRNEQHGIKLPVFKKGYNYVHLYFPNRGRYIISQMRNWIFGSIILLVLLVGFSFSLYYFFKQKFLVEVQKDFINNVTHEFSTPLSVIEIAVDGLKKPGIEQQRAKHEKYVDSIKYQADYLKSHIANLIQTVVAGNYHLLYNKKMVVPNELLQKAVAQLEPLLAKSNGSVQWQLEENNTAIAADSENLYLALFNVINNAIKYAPEPKIIISTYSRDSRYWISIKDNGIGIDPSQQKKIFRKFYRVTSGNLHAVKGLGLGLYFTRKVIKGHGGTIHVNSIPSVGTEFLIDLPLIN